jgi:hypothetical protein
MSLFKQIEQLFDGLDHKNQLLVIERLVRRLRLGATDKEAFAQEMQEMGNDPDIQDAVRDRHDWEGESRRPA